MEALDAPDPATFDPGRRRHMWICCHPRTGEPETDQAYSSHATGTDGVDWARHGAALAGRSGEWDQRMARITAVLLDGDRTLA